LPTTCETKASLSIFALAPDRDRVAASLRALEDDLRSGAWDARHGSLRHTASIDAGYRLVATER
jgi:hypothetical protein